MTTKVVIGKRLPFWRGVSGWEALFILAAPVLVVLSARWFLGLRHVQGGLFNDDNFADTVMGGLLALVGLGVAWYGISGLLFAKHTGVIVSACPCCATVRQRNFADAGQHDEIPAACEVCLAYLRVKGLEVSEESIESCNTMASWYSLPPERYAATARRDEGNRLLFEMPAMCAVCRSPDAPLLRNILFRYRSSADAGILGTIASAAASEAAADTGLSYSTRPQHNAPSSTVAAGEQFDEALSHLKTPVCTQHTQADDNYGVGNAVSYSKGVLFFASYGYYKAFCALNQIRDAAPPAV